MNKEKELPTDAWEALLLELLIEMDPKSLSRALTRLPATFDLMIEEAAEHLIQHRRRLEGKDP